MGTADTGVRPYDYAVTTSPTDFSMIAKNSSASCSVVTKGGAMPTQSWAGRVSDPAGFRLCNPVNWFSSLDAHPFARRVHRFPEIGASLHIEPKLCTVNEHARKHQRRRRGQDTTACTQLIDMFRLHALCFGYGAWVSPNGCMNSSIRISPTVTG
ncbi:hypothetical protein BH24CHL4_BH24CHL4_17610 [soil metagenome]